MPASRRALPASGLLACWLGSCLRGTASPDELIESLEAWGPEHVVSGLEPGEAVPLVLTLGALRRRGAVGCSLALPVPGDPVGLAGPPSLNAAAMDAGEAVVVTGAGLALVPGPTPFGTTWAVHAAEPVPPPDPGQAGTDLRLALEAATRRLVDLDVARWQPEVADVLTDLAHPTSAPLPPGMPPRVAQTVDRALLCREVVALARTSEGGAVSAAEMAARRDALAPLDRAARHALVAACSV